MMTSHHHADKKCPSDEDEYDYDYSDDPSLEKIKLSTDFPEVEMRLMTIDRGVKTKDCIKGLFFDGVKQQKHQHIYLSLLSQIVAKRHAQTLSDDEFADLCLRWCLAWAKRLHTPAEAVAPHIRAGVSVFGLKDFHPPQAAVQLINGRKVVQVRYWVAPSVGNEPVQHYNEKVYVFDRTTGKEITDEIFDLPEHDREFPAPRNFEYWLT